MINRRLASVNTEQATLGGVIAVAPVRVKPLCAGHQELSGDKAVAAAELERTLGTLRYLKGLQAARARAVAAQGPSPSTPLLTGQGEQHALAALRCYAQMSASTESWCFLATDVCGPDVVHRWSGG